MYKKSYNKRGKRKFNRNNRRRGSNSYRGNRGGSINIEGFIKKVENAPEKKKHVVESTIDDLSINSVLKQNILNKGFTAPTAIQDQAINPILNGKDLIGLANTGTGKTAAYLIPLIEKILNNKKEKVLIIAPTRELASQINAEFYSLRKDLNIYSVLVTGGANINRQIRELNRDFNFLIATPGRLKDLIKRRKVNISNVNTFVLDEVDRMLDMGFIKDIKYFTGLLPKKRQSLFFSATSSRKIEDLINNISHNPVKVDVTRGITASNIMQKVIKYSHAKQKIDILHDMLIKSEFEKVLIFGRTKVGVNRLSKELKKRGFSVDEIHGNKRQGARNKSLKLFKENHVDILVATDVASRGIDVDDITHVINYEIPDTFKDYIHRIGRTGRINKKGHALTFVRK